MILVFVIYQGEERWEYERKDVAVYLSNARLKCANIRMNTNKLNYLLLVPCVIVKDTSFYEDETFTGYFLDLYRVSWKWVWPLPRHAHGIVNAT